METGKQRNLVVAVRPTPIMLLRTPALALALCLSAFAQSAPQSPSAAVAADTTSAEAFRRTRLGVVRNGNEVIISWELPNPTVKGLEIFRNTRDQAPGRTRVATVRTQPNAFHDVLPDDSVTYWYWLKITLLSGETVNVGPVATPDGAVWTP